MVSAMDCTCEELTGSGNDATAASMASFMMPMISGENDAFEKSFNEWSFFKSQKRISKLRPQDGALGRPSFLWNAQGAHLASWPFAKLPPRH